MVAVWAGLACAQADNELAISEVLKTVTGSIPITAGTGRAIIHGGGRPSTAAAGSFIPIMAGFGTRIGSGGRPGWCGAAAATTAVGSPCPRARFMTPPPPASSGTAVMSKWDLILAWAGTISVSATSKKWARSRARISARNLKSAPSLTAPRGRSAPWSAAAEFGGSRGERRRRFRGRTVLPAQWKAVSRPLCPLATALQDGAVQCSDHSHERLCLTKLLLPPGHRRASGRGEARGSRRRCRG